MSIMMPNLTAEQARNTLLDEKQRQLNNEMVTSIRATSDTNKTTLVSIECTRIMRMMQTMIF